MTVQKSTISRRRALSGAATAGIGVPLLAACGDDGGGDSSASDPSTPATSSSAPRSTGTTKPTKTRGSEPAGDGIPTAEVPVGGGLVMSDEQVVLTQPTEGEFRAFTSICTHAGCPVARVTTDIECDCHGSRYSIEDGSVVGGPAPAPLAAVEFTVNGDQITLA